MKYYDGNNDDASIWCRNTKRLKDTYSSKTRQDFVAELRARGATFQESRLRLKRVDYILCLRYADDMERSKKQQSGKHSMGECIPQCLSPRHIWGIVRVRKRKKMLVYNARPHSDQQQIFEFSLKSEDDSNSHDLP